MRHDELLKKINFWVFSVGTKLVPCMLLTYLSLALIRVLVEAEKRKMRLKQSNLAPCPRLRAATTTTTSSSAPDRRHSNLEAPPAASLPLLTPHDKNNTAKRNLSATNLAIPMSTAAASSTSSSGGSCGHLAPTVKKQTVRTGNSCQPSDRTTKMLLAVLLLFLLTEFPSGILTLLSGIMGEAFFQNVYQPLGELIDILALINSGINFILYCAMSRLFRKTFSKVFCSREYYTRYASHVPNEYTNYNVRKMSNCHTIAQTELLGHTVHTTLV